MTIRPIDMQIIIPRATEVGKAQHTLDQQNIQQQQHFAAQWQQISEKRQQQVQHTGKSEQGKVNREKESKQQFFSERDHHESDTKEKDDEDHSPQTNPDPIRGSRIDIKT